MFTGYQTLVIGLGTFFGGFALGMGLLLKVMLDKGDVERREPHEMRPR